MKPKAFDLEAYLPYLMNRAAVRFVAAIAPTLAEADVSLQEWRVLAALRQAQGQRVSDLAGMTSIDISTLSRTLNAMQRKGLIVRRRPVVGDARVVTVHLTAAGETATEGILPAAQRLETQALAGFTAAEAATLKSMIERVYRNTAAAPAAQSAKGMEPSNAGLAEPTLK